MWIYNPLAGPINIILSGFDIASPRWFKENYLVIFAICTIIGWKVFGYNLIVMLAAMVAVPKEMIEAAKLENASNGFTLQNNRLGSYIQSTALDMLSDKQTAISGVSMAYKSIDSYKDAMKTLQESIGTMKNTTTDLKNTLKEKNLKV